MSKTTLVSTLTGDGSVSALVGDRVMPRIIEEGASLPAVVYQRVARDPAAHLKYVPTADDNRYQVTSWATTDVEAETLAAAVRVALEAANFRHVLEIDAEYEKETKRYGVRQDYTYFEQR